MKLGINKIIRVLILSDLSIGMGAGLLAPVFAIFLTMRIQGGNAEVAGFASGVYLITQAILILPISKYLDKNHGEKDDLFFIIIGTCIAGFATAGYLISSQPWHIYLIEFFYALGWAMNIPGYTAIYTRHVDKGKEAFGWSARAAVMGIGGGVAGALGGVIATRFGFDILIMITFVGIMAGGLLPLLIIKSVSTKNMKVVRLPKDVLK